MRLVIYLKSTLKDLEELFWRYIKFKKICRVLEIYPFYWQKMFILYGIPIPEEKMFHRATGVTTAVLIKLMLDGKHDWGFEEIRKLLEIDPDYDFYDVAMNNAYYGIYKKMQKKCNDEGINVCTFDRYFSTFSTILEGGIIPGGLHGEGYC